jgi:putative PIG3 family NAD(P)H quinone oxidoreductase
MRVIDVPQPGGPAALVLSERPLPSPAADQVLIKVAAAGLNRADVMQRQGKYPPPPEAPPYPGLEVSGTVALAGDAVKSFRVGDQVCALLQGGGYAEYCVVAEGQVLPIPQGVSLIDAAALPEAYFTVWNNVFQLGSLQRGEKLLVHGGSSGIGTTAIQLAAVFGNEVFVTAGSQDKCRFCESLGAKKAINYKEQDFVAEIMQVTNKAGVNVVLDMIAGDYVQKNLDVLAPRGRVVIIATQGGRSAQIDFVAVMARRSTITGSMLRPQSVAFKAQIKDQLLTHVWPLFESGKLRPIVDCVLPFTAAPEAHARMESSEHIGKILLRVD